MTIARTICVGFVAVIIIGTLLLMMPFAITSETWNWSSLVVALFTSTSAVCVTGLAVVDTGTYFSFWGQLTIALLAQVGGFGYMTSTTFLILLLGRKFDLRQKFAIQESFDRPFLQGKSQVTIYQREVPSTLILKTVAVVFGTAASIVLITVLISSLEANSELLPVLFEVVSAFGTVGLSTGITSSLSVASKLLIVLAMYIGRVNILLLIAAFIGDPSPSSLHYPEENLLVG
jgi:trk system potassium uptake protein